MFKELRVRLTFQVQPLYVGLFSMLGNVLKQKELGVGVKPASEAQFCCILKVIIGNVRSCGDEMR